MFMQIGDDIGALREAARLCDLEFREGPAPFVYESLPAAELPEWVFELREEFHPDRAPYVLSLAPPAAALCSRTPHGVGVFEHRGQLYAVWDGVKDGFGLLAYIGQYGERLKTFYVTRAAARVAARLGLTRFDGVGDAETTYLEYSDMAQKKIIVRVDPKGNITVKTEGFEGAACKDATKQLEQALGTVVADQPTQEMYAPPEQTTTIGSS